jgi:hypothetical protein
MKNTLQTLGAIVRNNVQGRAKYHPLIRKIELENKDTARLCYHVDVDTVNKTIKINHKPVPTQDVSVLKYDTGGNTFRYLIGALETNSGTDYIKHKPFGKGMKKVLNHYAYISQNLADLGIIEPIMLDFAEAIDNNQATLDNFFATLEAQAAASNIAIEAANAALPKKATKAKATGFLVNFTVNGLDFIEYPEIIDAIDTAYISYITDTVTYNGKPYVILKNSIYGFYKTSADNGLSQSPNFNLLESFKSLPVTASDLADLIYGQRFHTNIKGGNIGGDFWLALIPTMKGMTYDVLERFMETESAYYDSKQKVITKAQYLQNNNEPLITKALTLADQIAAKKNGLIKPYDINFDLVFKLVGGNTTQDISIISNMNVTKLHRLNDHILSIHRELKTFDCNLIEAFHKFLKKPEKKDTREYRSLIVKWVMEIFNGNYYDNPIIDDVFISKFSHIIRNTSEDSDIKKEYSKLLKHYKFLKFMQNNGRQQYQQMTDTASYQLGYSLGIFAQTYQTTKDNDRRNIVRFVKTYNGQIERRIHDMNDIYGYFNQVMQRLHRNNCTTYGASDFTEQFMALDQAIAQGKDKLNIQQFIFGYFHAQNSYIKAGTGAGTGAVTTEENVGVEEELETVK